MNGRNRLRAYVGQGTTQGSQERREGSEILEWRTVEKCSRPDLSRTDCMMVARQFIGWIVYRKDPSRRDGMRDGQPGLTTLPRSLEKPDSLLHKRRTPIPGQ